MAIVQFVLQAEDEENESLVFVPAGRSLLQTVHPFVPPTSLVEESEAEILALIEDAP